MLVQFKSTSSGPIAINKPQRELFLPELFVNPTAYKRQPITLRRERLIQGTLHLEEIINLPRFLRWFGGCGRYCYRKQNDPRRQGATFHKWPRIGFAERFDRFDTFYPLVTRRTRRFTYETEPAANN